MLVDVFFLLLWIDQNNLLCDYMVEKMQGHNTSWHGFHRDKLYIYVKLTR